MRRYILVLGLLFATLTVHAAAPHGAQPEWKSRVAESLPLLGHRNWILIVDSAYPLQTSPGVETIETNANQVDVVRSVLGTVHNSIHVRPVIYMDSELPFVSETDAPGVSTYRTQIKSLLSHYKIQSLLHEKIIEDIDEAGKTFHILVLKTNMTIPYTSVFIRLDCKYWTEEEENNLRTQIRQSHP